MAKYVAILDLGTNTFHLLVVRELPDLGFEVVERLQAAVKLGEGGMMNNLITEGGIKRGLQTIEKVKRVLNRYPGAAFIAIGTSMLREATNSDSFIARAEEVLDAEIRVISGDKEAEYIAHGVRQAVAFEKKPALIMDIGGGSVEFIIANDTDIFWKRSYETGAARLKEKFSLKAPVSKQQVELICKFLDDELGELFEKTKEYNIDTLAGAAGSFETLAQVDRIRYGLVDIPVTHAIDMEHFQAIYNKILSSTHKEIIEIPGMVAFRADMISAALITTDYVVRKAGIKTMIFSDYSMKEGVLYVELHKRLHH
ncbi:MAG: exopolyphosphatase [Bacteroidia bacterium]